MGCGTLYEIVKRNLHLHLQNTYIGAWQQTVLRLTTAERHNKICNKKAKYEPNREVQVHLEWVGHLLITSFVGHINLYLPHCQLQLQICF